MNGAPHDSHDEWFDGPDNTVALLLVGAPIVEETMKIGLTIWGVEKRPWLFSGGGLISGAMFAATEAVLYLPVFIPNPTDEIVLWRWMICILPHVSCSSLAEQCGCGLSLADSSASLSC